MEAFLEKVAEINGSINGVVWGIFGLALLIGTGIIVTLCTRVFQITRLKLWWKNTIGSLFTKGVMKHRKGGLKRDFVRSGLLKRDNPRAHEEQSGVVRRVLNLN